MSADPATAWARRVARGDVLAGEHVRAACRRHLDDLEAAADGVFAWDPRLGSRVTAFLAECCRVLVEGERRPFRPFGWQQFFVHSAFSWICGPNHPSRPHGARRFREAVLFAAKGAGKTPLLSGVGLFLLTLDGWRNHAAGRWVPEHGPECFVQASRMEQAQALGPRNMEATMPGLAVRRRLGLKVSSSTRDRRWHCSANGGWLRAIASGFGGLSGYIPHHARFEELHEWRAGEDTMEKITGGAKNRVQPLFVYASNSGPSAHGVAWDVRQRAIEACDPGAHRHNDLFGMVFECDPDDMPGPRSRRWAPRSATWPKANPSLGRIVAPDVLAARRRRARTERERIDFLRLFCGIWPGVGGGLFTRRRFDALVGDHPLPASPAAVYCGIDLGRVENFTAVAALHVPADGLPVLDVRTFVPGATLAALDKASTGHLRAWAERGFLHPSDGRPEVDFTAVARHIAELDARVDCRWCGDMRFMNELRLEAGAAGIQLHMPNVRDWESSKATGGIRIEPHNQGYGPHPKSLLGMDVAISDMRAAVEGAAILIRRNPVLSWALGCTQVVQNDRRECRLAHAGWADHGKGTNDPLVAAVMAVALWQRDERLGRQPKPTGFYDALDAGFDPARAVRAS